MVQSLPDLDAAPSEEEYKNYAEQTWVSVDWLRRERRHARSFCGIPVEVRGKPWGVLVLDSRSEKLVGKTAVQVYTLMGRNLGKVLERA